MLQVYSSRKEIVRSARVLAAKNNVPQATVTKMKRMMMMMMKMLHPVLGCPNTVAMTCGPIADLN